jgi:hypothetical protein
MYYEFCLANMHSCNYDLNGKHSRTFPRPKHFSTGFSFSC